MADLGMKRSELYGGMGMCCPETSSKDDYENQIVYPCLDLQGPQVEQAGLDGCEFGEEVTLTVKARVSRVGGQSQEDETPSMAFDIFSIEKEGGKGKGLGAAYVEAMDK